jgi:hypothetical protein
VRSSTVGILVHRFHETAPIIRSGLSSQEAGIGHGAIGVVLWKRCTSTFSVSVQPVDPHSLRSLSQNGGKIGASGNRAGAVGARGDCRETGGSGGFRHLRERIVGWPEPLSEVGTERAIVNGAASLQQEIGTSSRPAHLLQLVHSPIDQEVRRTFGDPWHGCIPGSYTTAFRRSSAPT